MVIAVVIGSSLQAFFDNTDDSAAPIWTALDSLWIYILGTYIIKSN